MLSVAFAAVRLGVLEILRIFSRTHNLHISKRFARASGVGLGEREIHLRQDAPATKSSGYPRPQAEPRRGAQAVASSGPPTSNARSFAKQSRKRVCANCEEYPPTEGRCRRQSLEWCRKPRAKAILPHSHALSPNATVVQRAAHAPQI